MDLKDYLILGMIGLGFGGLILANKANYCELKAHQLEVEIIRLKAKHEGFKESALMLND